MNVIGIDLAGPANHKDTVLTVFKLYKTELVFEEVIENASDELILTTIEQVASKGPVVIGIDAPLSYQDGGGDRPQDKCLRNFMKSYGLSGTSVMPPTLTRMVYLTLRGITLTRSIMALDRPCSIHIVEVHPGAAIGTRIGKEQVIHALLYKKETDSRKRVFAWLKSAGLLNLPDDLAKHSHTIDACAAALAAWHWADPSRQPTWQWKEQAPEHPFDFCC